MLTYLWLDRADLHHASRTGDRLRYPPLRPYRSIVAIGMHERDEKAKTLAKQLISGLKLSRPLWRLTTIPDMSTIRRGLWTFCWPRTRPREHFSNFDHASASESRILYMKCVGLLPW
jgi:hypothetical protein